MTKYTVLIGFNAPDPGGKRDAKGRSVEVRFDADTSITEGDVSPKALDALLAQGAIKAEGEEAPLDTPPPSEARGKKSSRA